MQCVIVARVQRASPVREMMIIETPAAPGSVSLSGRFDLSAGGYTGNFTNINPFTYVGSGSGNLSLLAPTPQAWWGSEGAWSLAPASVARDAAVCPQEELLPSRLALEL